MIFKAVGEATRTAGNNLYAWTWKDDPAQPDDDKANHDRTFTQAFDDIQAEASQLAATIVGQNGYTAKIRIELTIFKPDAP